MTHSVRGRSRGTRETEKLRCQRWQQKCTGQTGKASRKTLRTSRLLQVMPIIRIYNGNQGRLLYFTLFLKIITNQQKPLEIVFYPIESTVLNHF